MRAVKTLTLFFLFPLFCFSQFRPDSIAGLQLWLSADSGITFSTGDTISQWADRSGAAHDAAQGSLSNQPRQITGIPLLNNKPVVRLDGIDDYMLVADSLNVGTVFVISNWGDATSVFPSMQVCSPGSPVRHGLCLKQVQAVLLKQKDSLQEQHLYIKTECSMLTMHRFMIIKSAG